MAGRWVLVIALAASLAGCWGADPEEEISFDPSKMPAALPEVEPSQTDWPWWRGPNRDNISPATNVPTEWDEDTNILWKTKVPGRGHASPTIWGNRIFLATADESAKTQSVVCYEKDTGDLLWETEVHEGSLGSIGNHEASHANSAVATDGERLFATFLHDGAVWVSALDFDGKPLWETNAGRFSVKNGYGPSPAIYKSFVIIAADHEDGGYLAAIHRKTGDILWRKNRPAKASYSSPLIAHVGGRDQLLIAGCDLVAGYDPNNGEELWSVKGTATSVAGTMAAYGDLVVASGGWGGNETICIDLSDAPKVVWRNNKESYVPSMVVYNGALYQVFDDGRLVCLDLASEETHWQARMGGGVSATPVYADGNVFVMNERGKCTVFKASTEKFQKVAENQLGDEAFATPAIVDGRIYLRAADSSSGSRQEFLYCIANQ